MTKPKTDYFPLVIVPFILLTILIFVPVYQNVSHTDTSENKTITDLSKNKTLVCSNESFITDNSDGNVTVVQVNITYPIAPIELVDLSSIIDKKVRDVVCYERYMCAKESPYDSYYTKYRVFSDTGQQWFRYRIDSPTIKENTDLRLDGNQVKNLAMVKQNIFASVNVHVISTNFTREIREVCK